MPLQISVLEILPKLTRRLETVRLAKWPTLLFYILIKKHSVRNFSGVVSAMFHPSFSKNFFASAIVRSFSA